MNGPALRWQVLYEELRTKIEQGIYAPGDAVPSERELLERYGCSRQTVRRALTHLEQQGLVTVKRSGRAAPARIVREPLNLYFDATKFERIYADDPERGLDQWSHDVVAQGWEHHQVPMGAWRQATPLQARWLGVELRTQLWRRRRIRSVRLPDDAHWNPVMISDSWFPKDIAIREAEGSIPLMADHNVTLRGGIMRAIGVNQVKFIDEIRARMPSDEESQLLELPPGTPVLELARVGIDDTGRRVRVIVNTIDSSSQYLKYVLDVPLPLPAKDAATETEPQP